MTDSNKTRPLDRIDRTILDTLQKDGRISNVELAKRVNLSPSPCIDRVRKLEQEGFIEKFYVSDAQTNELIVDLKYQKTTSIGSGALGKPCITNLKRISKPGLRIYVNHRQIPRILGGTGIVILSTPSGLMTDREARSRAIGGELLCSIW